MSNPTGEDRADRILAVVDALGDPIFNDTRQTLVADYVVPDPAAGTGRYVHFTLGANVQITLPPPAVGKRVTLLIDQDATGSRTVTWAVPGGTVKWPGAAAPTLTTTAHAEDVIDFESYDGASWVGKPSLHVG